MILTVAGRIGRAAAPAFREAVQQALQPSNPLVVIDLALVDYVSSAGIAVFDLAVARARDARVTLVVAGIAEVVRVSLDLGGVLTQLMVEPTRSAAVTRALQ